MLTPLSPLSPQVLLLLQTRASFPTAHCWASRCVQVSVCVYVRGGGQSANLYVAAHRGQFSRIIHSISALFPILHLLHLQEPQGFPDSSAQGTVTGSNFIVRSDAMVADQLLLMSNRWRERRKRKHEA